MSQTLATVISQINGSGPGVILNRMAIIEEEIARAQHERPDQAGTLFTAFLVCQTPMIPRKEDLNPLFRVHARQLLRIIAAGTDVDLPTLPEVSVMAVGIAQVAPPITDLALLVTSDVETMEAYGMEPQPAPRHIGDHLWPELREACRRAFHSAYGQYRSQIWTECRRNYKTGRRMLVPTRHTAISLEDLADRYLYAVENELAEILTPLQEGDEWTAAVQQCGALTGLPWHQYLSVRREHFAQLRTKVQRE